MTNCLRLVPTIIDGLPSDIKTINMGIDIPGFTFNPTSCNPMSVTGTGTVTGVEGATAPTSSSFWLTNCNRLQTITSNDPNLPRAVHSMAAKRSPA